MILGPYPENVGLAVGDIDPVTGDPTNEFVLKQCDESGCTCYEWIQGTSMASPMPVGVAALIVSEHGGIDLVHGGLTSSPDQVRIALKGTATDHECVPFNYAGVGRHPASRYNVRCEWTAAYNNVDGDGIVNALAAVNL